MKFKEIISEANRQGSGLLGPMVTTPSGIQIPMWPSASLSARTGNTAPRPRAERQSGKRASALRQQYIKNAVIKLSGSTRYKNMIAMKYSKFTAALLVPLRLLQFLGLGEMIIDFFNTKATLQIMKELPEDDPNHISEEEYDDNWRQALELLAVQIGASAALPRLIQAFALGRWVTRILGFLGTTATWGATLALFVASEVAMIAFQRWLTSPEGKRSLSYLIVYVIDPLANWLYPTSLINKIKELVGMEQDKKPDETKPDDGKKPSTNSNQAAQPDIGARTDTTIRTPNVPSSYQGNPNDLMTKPTKKEPLPFS